MLDFLQTDITALDDPASVISLTFNDNDNKYVLKTLVVVIVTLPSETALISSS